MCRLSYRQPKQNEQADGRRNDINRTNRTCRSNKTFQACNHSHTQGNRQELVKATNGLTQFAEEIMYLTDNSYTQKLYEMILHWKDKEVFSISPDEFRERLSLGDKYPQIKDLVRRVIKPAEMELKDIADVFFIFNTSSTGRKITKFNFVIKHKKTLHEDELNQIRF